MNDDKLKELNKLKNKIDELDKFLTFGSSVRIKLLGKILKFKRMHTGSPIEYDVPKEIYADVMDVLRKHLIKLQKEFEGVE